MSWTCFLYDLSVLMIRVPSRVDEVGTRPRVKVLSSVFELNDRNGKRVN